MQRFKCPRWSMYVLPFVRMDKGMFYISLRRGFPVVAYSTQGQCEKPQKRVSDQVEAPVFFIVQSKAIGANSYNVTKISHIHYSVVKIISSLYGKRFATGSCSLKS